jgi:hypothetical protein
VVPSFHEGDFQGTGLAPPFELGRWEIAERLMQSAVVEPADVLDHGDLELGFGAPDAVGDQLRLEAVDERLGERVVIGVADRADRGQHAVIGQRLGVVDRGVLAAADALMFVK